jgi:predicted NUDIX family NTP pyrophosphohydrolase
MKLSAGLLIYRRNTAKTEVLLVHPGGPFWAKKDEGAWSVPKGEYEDGEPPQLAARREFEEELGIPAPKGELIDLGQINRNGKLISAWAVADDPDISQIKSNTIFIDWPPRSGKQLEVPEVDRAEWVEISQAPAKMHKGQNIFIERLAEALNIRLEPGQSLTQSSLF